MIDFRFNISHPFDIEFKNFWSKSWSTVFKNKFIELEFYKDSTIVSFMFNWTVGKSHAGLDIELGIFGYNAHFNFYDSRHWDYENKCWQTT